MKSGTGKVVVAAGIIVLLWAQCGSAAGVMRDISAMDLVRDMEVGWNLGNTLDATGGTGVTSETSWGNPKTSREMIDALRAKGFKTIRIPVTWDRHFGAAPDYVIDGEWLDRVEEVVGYVIDAGMYAILNSHHDEWVTLTASSQQEVTGKITTLWTQIANRFRDYSDYLVFETLNEPRTYGTSTEWSGGTPEARTILNAYNKAIVEAIRTTGGNNQIRHIMIPTHAATAMAVAQDALVIPNGDARIIISQHTYWPYEFTMQKPGVSSWGTDKDKAACDEELDRIYNRFCKKGIPVVIGEWGAIDKDNTAARAIHAGYYANAVRKRGMLPVWWDNGDALQGGFALLNRKVGTWYFPEIVEALVNGAKTAAALPARRESAAGIENVRMESGYVSGVVPVSTSLSLSLFDLRGRVLFRCSEKNREAGTFRYAVPKNYLIKSGVVQITTQYGEYQYLVFSP